MQSKIFSPSVASFFKEIFATGDRSRQDVGFVKEAPALDGRIKNANGAGDRCRPPAPLELMMTAS
jgi:hypothetical protein